MDASSGWWNEETVAVVTGGNKGIGLEVCKQLGDKGLKVILTARDENRGRIAVRTLNEQGLHNIIFHHLDVQDDQSIATLASWLLKEQGGLDILINNAAVSSVMFDQEYVEENNIDTASLIADLLFKPENPKGFIIDYEAAKSCLDTNYYGAKRVTKALIPLLRSSLGGARIVNLGSDFGQLRHLQSAKLQQELTELNNLSERCIDDLLDRYLDDVKSKSLENKGWPLKVPSYKMSKLALHAYTRTLAKDMEKRPQSRRIFVNCVHPGIVRTDMTFLQGNMTPKEGAENVVRVALFPPQECPSGKFFYEKTLSNF